MRFRKEFIKTRRTVSREIESINGQLLTKGGFVHQEIAGVYSFLPLGLRALNKVEAIIRKHMNEIATEIVMSALQPVANWKTTSRLETYDTLLTTVGANKASKLKNRAGYILGPTHEEIVTPLVSEFVNSYKDLPLAVYQIQTKFRNEARAKSGLLRSREFRMKDLYSFHKDEKELLAYYEVVKNKYFDIYKELGIGEETFYAFASGGDFTKEFSNEFQTLVETGEDILYVDRAKKLAYNKEIVTEENARKLGVKFDELEQAKGCEVGNIFPLNTRYSDAFDFKYMTEDGSKKPVYMGCYGLGSTRTMGVIVEKCHDDKGIIWPAAVAPYRYHLISLSSSEKDDSYRKALDLYEALPGEILWDDRLDAGVGEKFADADLIGCPIRVVVSEKSLKSGGFEVKQRKLDEIVYVKSIEELKKLP